MHFEKSINLLDLMTAPTPKPDVVIIAAPVEHCVIYANGKFYKSFTTLRGCLISFGRLSKKIGYGIDTLEWECVQSDLWGTE